MFVYGTLLRGELRAPIIERARPKRIDDAEIRGHLVDLGPYPGLVLPGGRKVRGELVRTVDAGALLGVLDDVEDFTGYGRTDAMYRRVIVRVGDDYAWTYRYVGPDTRSARTIESGDWRRR